MTQVSIEVRNLVKKFGSFKALDGVDLKVNDGELLALITLVAKTILERRLDEGQVVTDD